MLFVNGFVNQLPMVTLGRACRPCPPGRPGRRRARRRRSVRVTQAAPDGIAFFGSHCPTRGHRFHGAPFGHVARTLDPAITRLVSAPTRMTKQTRIH
jgi:hypothetical protein